MERLTVTELRADIYRIIDEVIRTGEPREITRGGNRVYLGAKPAKKSKKPPVSAKPRKINDLSKIVPLKDALTEDPEFYRIAN